MSNIIDRRKNTSGKSINNRQKFLKRVEDQIKKAIPDILSQESITESSNGGKVKVPVKGIDEPSFHHDANSGKKQIVKPGNDRFNEGDKIPKPQGGGEGPGKGKGSNSPGTTEDEFAVILSRDEFLKYFFDDLELPNMIKKFMESTVAYKNQRAGYTKNSVPSRLNIKTTYQQALGRQIALKGAYKKKLEVLTNELAKTKNKEKKIELEAAIEKIRKQMLIIPLFEDVDLRYNNFEMVPTPVTSAVIFCIMDVSASMGYYEKDIAKRFFTLLYIFLTKQYKEVQLVFIRHHTEAKEVNEDEFFNSRESGGTIVAPSLQLMKKIIQERYDDDRWNIYCCQASDGDTWSNEDALQCHNILKQEVLPMVQYMAYIEIKSNNSVGDLWSAYSMLKNMDNFAMKNINHISQIWPVFKQLFQKKKVLQES